MGRRFIPAFGKGFWKSKMFSLMVTILLLFLAYPYVISHGFFGVQGSVLITVILSAILIASVYAVSTTRSRIVVSLILGIPALVLRWYSFSQPTFLVLVLLDLFQIGFYIYVISILLKHIFNEKRVTADEIYGGVSIYMLIGLLWSVAYSFMNVLFEGSFGRVMMPTDFIYFSIVTLTTLGYGDITPIGPHVQSLAILEAMIGTLYLTVMVARLVGLYTAENSK